MLKLGNRQGFTVVELLVVIVVIAILASVSVVAYGGVQTRAENSKTLAGIDQFGKALQIYKARNDGKYPLTGGGFQFGCIAESGTCGNMDGTTNAECVGLGVSGISATLNTAMKTVINTIPAVSDQTMQCQNKNVKGALYVNYGTTYIPAGDPNVYILYFLKGDQPCSTPAGSKPSNLGDFRTYYPSGATRCVILFEA
ncbi:MAG TPA: prepilin-type N-terminal cleavage/methylation domain-containing protein [Candidatus Saccharimonadales bacterium]